MDNLTGDPDFDKLLQRCIDILGTKGRDYSLGREDKLHNFKTAGAFLGLTPSQTLGVYLYKHISAVFMYIKAGKKCESEPIEERIADCINYLLLLYKLIKETTEPSDVTERSPD